MFIPNVAVTCMWGLSDSRVPESGFVFSDFCVDGSV